MGGSRHGARVKGLVRHVLFVREELPSCAWHEGCVARNDFIFATSYGTVCFSIWMTERTECLLLQTNLIGDDSQAPSRLRVNQKVNIPYVLTIRSQIVDSGFFSSGCRSFLCRMQQ